MTTIAAPDLRRRKKVNWQKVLLIVTFSAVPLFLLILFTYVPFVKMIKFSFFDIRRPVSDNPAGGIAQ